MTSMTSLNEPILAVVVGLLLSLSAGFRVMLPLLAVNLLAYFHKITLPDNLTWMSSESTLILLSVATVTETMVHFIPAAGTWIKAAATPLSFIGGTLLMAVPLGDHNPLYQWTLAAVVGGGAATLTHIGVTGVRALTAPANAATLGLFGIFWNIGEFLISILLTLLSGLCLVAGTVIAVVILVVILTVGLITLAKMVERYTRSTPAT